MTTKHSTNDLINTFLFVLGYAGMFYVLQFFFYKIDIFHVCPNELNMAQWDVGWYRSIVDKDYGYNKDGGNSAFFILFPWIWKLLHVNIVGICIVNIFFFAFGFSILCRILNVTNTIDKLFWLSVPTVYFAFIPYTEALYFLLCSILLLGIEYNKQWIVWISLILLSLTRVTSVFFLPAFLIMSLVTSDRKLWFKSICNYIIDYAIPIVLGSAIFILYQYQKTGVWFAYYKQQRDHWGHAFSWPAFPLENMDDNRTIWLGALSIFVCLTALIFTTISAYKWLLRNKIETRKLFILSTGYLTMVLIPIIFFSPKWTYGNDHTNIIGAHRYGLMNTFFYVFLYYLVKERQYIWKHYLFTLLFANVVWLLFGSYSHIQHLLFFTVDTVIVLLFMLSSNKQLTWPATCLIAINFFFQLPLFQQFISGHGPD